mmetsp:Transcript_34754/g.41912  ORF Transcript_34754/g.41912 Transcript_34754/m.41912 type:complete len:240 (+) Transcript_34754:191-910(+)
MLMPTSDRETAKQAERMLIKPRSINFRLNVFASEVNTGIPGEKPVTIKMIDATTKRQNTTKELGRAEAKLLRQRAPSPNYSYDRNTGSNRRATSNHEKEDDYIMSLATSDASSLSRSSLRNKQRQGINLIVDHAKLVTNEELNAQRNSNSKQENILRTRSRQKNCLFAGIAVLLQGELVLVKEKRILSQGSMLCKTLMRLTSSREAINRLCSLDEIDLGRFSSLINRLCLRSLDEIDLG